MLRCGEMRRYGDACFVDIFCYRMGLNECSNALNSREKPAVSPMSSSPTFDIDKSATPYGEGRRSKKDVENGPILRNVSDGSFLKSINYHRYIWYGW